MKLFTIKYQYFIEYNAYDTLEVYADSVAHAYQQFKKLVCTSNSTKLRNWTGLCDISHK